MTFTGITDVRDGFGAALLELGRTNKDVVALGADLTDTLRFDAFSKEFPDRYFQIGISEVDMMGTAAGLALGGKIAFPGTFAIFAASLAHQTVRLTAAYNQANVKIAASHGGVTVGADGATHQAIEDIALMRVLPGMTVLVPADANEAYKATLAAAEMDGPVYIRLARGSYQVVTEPDAPYTIGKADVLRQGSDAALISTGPMTVRALEAADQLAQEGLNVRVIHMHTIKPIDEQAIIEAARECGAVVTFEEHSVLGGLGSSVAEVLVKHAPVPVEMVGVQDVFGESGEPDEILEKYGMTAHHAASAVRCAVKKK